MTTRCKDPNKCPNGNCSGCHNGQLFCTDSTCFPNCRGCVGSTPLSGSRFNTDEDLQQNTTPSNTSILPQSTDTSFYSENPIITIIIVVLIFLIIGYIFYLLFKKIESEPNISTNTSS
jgi:hypothetical protein